MEGVYDRQIIYVYSTVLPWCMMCQKLPLSSAHLIVKHFVLEKDSGIVTKYVTTELCLISPPASCTTFE